MYRHRITADFSQLERQAREQARDYFDDAYRHLEKVQGKDYADRNPAVIAAMIAAASNEMVWSTFAVKLQDLTETISEIGDQLNETLGETHASV